MILYKELNFSIDNNNFQIPLPGPKNIIIGDNATGKSLFVYSIGKIIRSKGQNFLELCPEIKPNIVIFDYRLLNQYMHIDGITPFLLRELSATKQNLIIFDNMDAYVRYNDEVVDFINFDSSNQYLLFSRALNGIKINYRHCRKMKYQISLNSNFFTTVDPLDD